MKIALDMVILRYILLYFLEEAYLSIEDGLLLSIVLCTAKGLLFNITSQTSVKQFSFFMKLVGHYQTHKCQILPKVFA